MSISVYYNEPGNYWEHSQRELILNNYVIGVSGFQSKIDLTYLQELSHPSLTLDVDVLDLVNITTGGFVNFEVNNVIVLRTIVTEVQNSYENFTLTLQTAELLETLRDYTIEDVWDYINDEVIAHSVEEFYIAGIQQTHYRFNKIQMLWSLKVMLRMIGFPFDNQMFEALYEDDTGYEFTWGSINIKYKDLYFQANLFQHMGKSEYSDDRSANAYDVFTSIMRFLGLKYSYQDNNIVVNKILDSSPVPTIGGFSYTDIANVGVEITAEFIDITEDETPASFWNGFFCTIANFISSSGVLWSQLLTVEKRDENAESYFSLNFPTNFVPFYFVDDDNGLVHIPYSNVDWPWERSDSIWQQIYDKFKALITTESYQILRKYSTDQPINFNKDFNLVTVDLNNNLSKVEYYQKVEI